MQLLAAPIDRASLPDDVEVLKDLLVQAATAFQELRQQANAQMLSLAAQLAEFKRKVFGPRGEALSMLQPELWSERVELPVPPESFEHCRRRAKFEPPCRPNIEPGLIAFRERSACG
jgi:transposase